MKNKKEIIERLLNEYTNAVAELVKVKDLYEQELNSLVADPNEESRLMAIIEVNDRRSKDALVDGDMKLFTKHKERMAEAQGSLTKRRERLNFLVEELEKIDAQMEEAAKEVLKGLYPEIREAVFKKWCDALDFTEKSWDDIEVFGREVGIQVSNLYKDNLMIYGRGDTRELFRRVEPWIGTPIS